MFAAGALLALSSAASAHPPPAIVRTPAIVPDPSGYLLCVVRADSAVQIDVVTKILTVDRVNVTEFGSTFIASPIGTEDGRYHVEQDFGSMNDDARSCEVTVGGARKRDLNITVVLESRDASGAVIDSVQAP